MKYKHIVFDIDGTLIDTEYAVLHSLQETIKEIQHIMSFYYMMKMDRLSVELIQKEI